MRLNVNTWQVHSQLAKVSVAKQLLLGAVQHGLGSALTASPISSPYLCKVGRNPRKIISMPLKRLQPFFSQARQHDQSLFYCIQP